MGELADELPIINMIKRRMKKDDKFTKDQVRDFERRVSRSDSVRFLVEMIQEFHQKFVKLSEKSWKSISEARDEIEQLKAKVEKYEQSEQRLLEEFGEESWARRLRLWHNYAAFNSAPLPQYSR